MTREQRHAYAEAWPWTVKAVGARTMFLTAIAVPVYVTFILFGNYPEVATSRGLSFAEVVLRWIVPALALGAVALAVGLALYVWGTGREIKRGR